MISHLISLRFMLWLGATGTPPKLRWNRDRVQKACKISKNGARQDQNQQCINVDVLLMRSKNDDVTK